MERNSIRSTWNVRVAATVVWLALWCCTCDAANITWTNTSGGTWKTALNWSPNQVPGSSDDAVINLDGTYTVTVNATASVRGITLGGGSSTPKLSITAGTLTNSAVTVLGGAVVEVAGGILRGNGTLDVAGTLNWTKGEIRSRVHITPAGRLNLSGNNLKLLSGGKLDNEGTVVWSGNGGLELGQGASVNNVGVFEVQNDLSLTQTLGTSRPEFINLGTFRKTTASGITSFDAIEFRNSGTIDLQTGGLGFGANKHSLLDGSHVTGPGSVWVNGAELTLSGAVSTEAPMDLNGGSFKGTFNLTGDLNCRLGAIDNGATVNGTLNMLGGISSGTLTVNGAVNLVSGKIGGGPFTLNGDLNWSGGTNASTKATLNGNIGWSGGVLTGNMLVQTGRTLTVTGSALKQINGGVLTNQGAVRLEAPNGIKCDNGAMIYNYGSFLLANDTPFTAGVTTPSRFYNYGSLVKGGTGQLKWEAIELHNRATVEVQAGIMALGIRAHSLGDNSAITGAGRLQWLNGSLALGTNVSVAQTLEFLDGALTGSGAFNGNIEWIKGSLAGVLTVPVGRQIHLTGNGTKTFTKDSVLNVAGEAFADGNDSLLFFANATINNTGTFEFQTDGNFTFNSTDKAWFNNAGILRKTISTAVLPFGALQLVNTGTLNLQAGDISLTANVQSLQNGSAIVGPGAVRVNGATLNLVGTVSSASPVYLATGGLSGTATLAAPLNMSGGLLSGAITMNGPVTYSAGEVAGTLTASETMEWTGGTISGTLVVPANASLAVKSGGIRTLTGVLNNAGVVTVQPLAAITMVNGTPVVNSGLFEVQDEVPFKLSGFSKPVFNNSGTFRKTTSARTLPLSFLILQNSGTVDVQAGGIDFTLNTHTFASGSRLTGPGPVRIAGATATMSSLLRVDSPFELASGSLIGDATIAGSLAMSGGQLPGVVLVTNAFTWSGGEVKGDLTAANRITWSGGLLSGILNVPASCRFDLLNGATKVMTGTLNNYGTLSLPALGQIQMDSGCVINNAGLCETYAVNPFSHLLGGTPTFNNAGTFRKLGAGDTTISLAIVFNSSGILEVASDSLSFISGTHTFSNGARLTGAGVIRLTGATVNWNGAVSNTAPVELVAGSLLAAGSINGAVIWSGGTLGGMLTIPPASELRLVGTATKTLDSVTVTNLGSMLLEGSGALAFFDDAIIQNYGLFELQTANSFTAPNSGKKWFNNYAMLRKKNSAQPFIFSDVLLQNAGTLDLQAGTIDFTLNNHALNNGSQVTGPGAVRVAGGMLTLGGTIPFSQPLQLNSGILTGTATNDAGLAVAGGQITGSLTVNGPVLYSAGEMAGTLTANQAMDWTGGTISGTLVIPDNASLTVKPGGIRTLTGVLNNAGVVIVRPSAAMTLVSGTPLVNSGLFEVQDSLSFTLSGTGKPVFSNSGTFRKTIDSGTLALGFLILQNTGTVDVQEGGLALTLNSHTFASGSRLIGSGAVHIAGASVTMDSSLHVECPFTLASGLLYGDAIINGSFAMSGGQLPGKVTVTRKFNWTGGEVKGTLTANELIAWSGGTLSGALNVPAAARLEVQDGNPKIMTGTLNNYGRLSLLDLASIQMDNGCVINNAGLCETWAAEPFGHVNNGVPTFNNTGVFRTYGSQPTTLGLGVNFLSSGVVDVVSSTLSFISGTHTFSSGAQFTGGGLTRIAGATINWNGGVTNTGPLEVASGLLLAAGSINGAVTWSGGTLKGDLAIPASSELRLADVGAKTLQAINLTNWGRLILEGSGALQFSGDAIVQNFGLTELQAANTFTAPDNGKKWFNNYGVLRKMGSAQAFAFGSAQLAKNTGTIDIQAGTIDFTLNNHALNNGSQVTGSGALRVAGGTLTLAGSIPFSQPLQLNSGILAGTATNNGGLTLAGGQFTGDLTVNGPVTFSGGEVAGTLTPNQTMDWSGGTISSTLTIPTSVSLTVKPGGTRLLSGVLNNAGTVTVLNSAFITLVSGTPLVNTGLFEVQDSLPFKLSGSSKPLFNNSGTFRKTIDSGTLALSFLLLQNSGTVDVQAGSIDFTLNDHTFANGSRLTGPGRVRIAGASVTMDQVLQVASAFELASGYLYGDATINGSLAMSGGQLPGVVLVTNTFTWSGGELKGALTANQRTVWSGGTMSGTLNVPLTCQLDLQDGNPKIMTGTLNNFGKLSLKLLSQVQLDSGAVINNAGSCETWATAPFKHLIGSTPTFNNSGTFRKLGATATTIGLEINFNQSGVVEVTSNSLSFISGTHTFSGGSRFTGAGLTRIAGATVNWNGAVTNTAPVELVSGSLLAAGSINGAVIWSGGTLGGMLTIPATSELRFVGTATKTLDSVTVTNLGSMLLEGSGALAFFDDAIIQNYGLFELRTANSFTAPNSGKKWFNNYAMLRKKNSAQPFVFSGVLLQNAGTLDLQAGTIDFTLNNHALNNGSQVTGPGVVRVAGGTLTLGGTIPFSQPLQLNSGILTGTATISGGLTVAGGQIAGNLTVNGPALYSAGEVAGTLTANQAMDWIGGTISGTLVIPAAANLTVKSGGTRLLTGAINNAGLVTVQPSAFITLVSGTPLVNSGVLEVQDDVPFKLSGLSKPILNNSGTFRKTTSTRTLPLSFLILQNSGTVDVQAGGIDFTLNTHTFASGSRLTGPGPVRIAGATATMSSLLRVESPFELASGSLIGDASIEGSLTMSGGQLPGVIVVTNAFIWRGGEVKGDITANGSLTWEGGLLSGKLTVPANTRANILPTSTKSISGVFQNAGFTVVSNTAAITLLGGTPVVNSGVLEVQNELPFKPNGTTKVNFINSGTFRKTTSIKLMKLDYVQLQNSGTLDLQAGELSLVLNTHSFTDGTRTTGTGAVHVAGATLNVAGTLTLGPALALDSGYLAGSATINGPFQFKGGEVQDKLKVNGEFAWAGGFLKGGICVEGAATWTGGEIDGWLGIATNSTLAISSAATKIIKGGMLTNSGLVTVASPVTIQADGGAVVQNFGAFNLPVSMAVTTPWGGKPTFNNFGSLSLTNGSGVFTFPGKLLQFPSGRLDIELGGRKTGVDFSQIVSVPELALDGALAVRTIHGFEPALGDRLEIIKCAARVGKFATYSANTPRLSPDYSPTNVTLSAAAPVLTSQPASQTVGSGTTVSFSADANGSQPLSWQWLRNGAPLPGATNTPLTLANVQPAQEGAYAVVVTNVWGSAESTQAVLKVIVPPAIVQQPISQTVKQGETATFSVEATGTYLSYRWKFGDNWLAGATNATLVLNNATLANAGKYKVEVSNPGGILVSTEVTLSVLAPPTIIEQPISQNVSAGSSPTLSVKVSGTAPFSYLWLKDGVAVTGATGSSLILNNVGPGQAGSYVVLVANATGTATSEPAIIAIKAPPIILVQPLSQSVNVGSNVLLTVTATGVPTPTYQWRKNGVTLPGATSSTLLLPLAQPRESGDYSVVVANSQGSIESAVAHITVTVPELLFTDAFNPRGIIYTATGYGHGTNVNATKESGEPNHGGKGSATKTVWISWWAPANGIVTFSTAGSDFDTVMAVYRGTAVNALTKVAADDDSAGFHCSKVSLNAMAGTYYQIAVAGVGGESGNIILSWDLIVTAEVLPWITQAPLDVTGNTNDTVALQVVFDAFEPTAIQWFYQGQTLAGATNATFVIPSLQENKVGGYAVRLTGASGRNVVSPPGDIQINTEGVSNVSARNKFFDAAERALTP